MIIFNLGADINPYFHTIYTENDSGSIQILKENITTEMPKDRETLNESDIMKFNSTSKLNRIIFHNGTINTFDPSAIHIFEYSGNKEYNKLFELYSDMIFDPETFKLLMERSMFLFIQSYLIQSSNPLTVEIKEMGPYWVQGLLPVILFIAAGSIYFVGRVIIKKLSKLDPIFSDFQISSSNLTKFKDLPDKTMSQCTICFEDFLPEDEIRILGCLHYYHPNCIDRWLIGHSRKCPCCRHSIEVNEKL